MPYKITKSAGKFLVVGPYKNKENHIYATHQSSKEAQKQLKALYANASPINETMNVTTIPSHLDNREVIIGTEIELEKTNDRDKAIEIALKNLCTNPRYYTDKIKLGKVDNAKALEIYDVEYTEREHSANAMKAPQFESTGYMNYPHLYKLISETEFTREYDTAINTMSADKARRYINKIARAAHHTGLYNDEYWKGKADILKAFEKAGIYYEVTSAEYDKKFPPQHKTWRLEFPFTNNRGLDVRVYGQLVASGAGSVNDPLDKYDIIFYC